MPDLSHGDPDTGNILIQDDNLDALKALLPFYVSIGMRPGPPIGVGPLGRIVGAE